MSTAKTKQNSDVPKHIGIIMDGNRRWARERGLDPIKGHEEGVETLRKIIRKAQDMGVTSLTIYAFSSENWGRTKREVAALIKLLLTAVVKDRFEIVKNGVRFRTIGDLRRFPLNLRTAIRELVRVTKRNNKFVFNLAINYGGRAEIVRAVRKLVKKGTSAARITEEGIASYLDTAGQADPDLIIRTGGEQRLSNFMLWQSSYSELYFSDRKWPEFSEKDFESAIKEYQKRSRRFGG